MGEYRYSVVVGNIGEVMSTHLLKEALQIYSHYKILSKNNYGRGGGEEVTLFDGEEVLYQHTPVKS